MATDAHAGPSSASGTFAKSARQTVGRSPLARIIITRLALTSLMAIFLQVCIVGTQYYLDREQFTTDFITREADTISRGISTVAGRDAFKLTAKAAHYRQLPGSYAFRITGSDGGRIAESESALLAVLGSWPEGRPDIWVRYIDGGSWPRFAGGQRVKRNGRDYWIDVAILDDPAGRQWGILMYELMQLVWLPMIPLIVLMLGVATISVQRLLQPLSEAASRLDAASQDGEPVRVDMAGMPREAASFAAALNRQMERRGELLRSQKIFLASAAHELRTPLAVMTLELGKIADPRARRMEADVAAMSELVNRMLTLVRLGTLEQPDLKPVDLEVEVEDLLGRMRPLVEANERTLVVDIERPGVFMGDASAVREAVRNLVENAVKHTPKGTKIRVSVGPGNAITVEDGGRGLGSGDPLRLFEPFAKGHNARDGVGLGLAIVRRAVELHGGKVETGTSPLGGALFHLTFRP
jgi:signal transduction histidine kinase